LTCTGRDADLLLLGDGMTGLFVSSFRLAAGSKRSKPRWWIESGGNRGLGDTALERKDSCGQKTAVTSVPVIEEKKLMG
jgi:hypothetical protein